MPRKSFRKKNVRRKRKRKRRGNFVYTPVQGNIVASRQLVKFKYRINTSLDVSATAGGSHVMSANGLYDPDVSGLGHQPIGFDQWMTFYDHYTVLGCKATATFLPTSGTASTAPQWVGLALTSGLTLATIDPLTMLEQKYTRKKLLTGSNAKGFATVSMNCSIKKYLGKRNVIDDPDLKGDASANPAEGVFLHILAAPYNPAINPDACYVSVELEYVALLTEPKQLTQS